MREISSRFKEFREAEGLTQQQMADLLGASKDRVGNWDTRTPPPYDAIIFLMKNFHLNPYWLLLGEGEMYRDTGTIHQNVESAVNYGKDSTVVHTNNGSIVAGEGKGDSGSADQGGRELRLCQFVQWWMQSRDQEDQVWLEKQIERAVPEYGEWKRGQGS